MLSIIRASTGNDLTTMAAVRAQMDVPTTDEPLVAALITAASRWAETFVGYPLRCQIYSETLPAFGGRHLMVSRTPIRSLAMLLDSTTTCQANEYTTHVRIEDADAGLLSLDDLFPWTPSLNQGLTYTPAPDAETRPWYAIYEAGFVIGGTTSTGGGTTSTGETLPADVQQGIIERVRELYSQPQNVSSKRVGELAITYATEADSVAQCLLEPYRRIL